MKGKPEVEKLLKGKPGDKQGEKQSMPSGNSIGSKVADGNGKQSEQGFVFDMSKIKAEVEKKLSSSGTQEQKMQITEKYVPTGVPGFDELLEHGIPKASNILVAGGAGSGKTIFCLQTLAYHASRGEKCFYMSFEEPEEKLIEHMEDFGWSPGELINSGNLKIKKYLPSDIHYFDRAHSVEAMFAKEEDSQLIELEPISLQLGYRVDFIVLDSLTAVASAFKGKEGSYRYYVERLFNFMKNLGSTNFLITETKQIPEIFSPTGVEEFLADGLVVMYNIRRNNIRENAIEVLKMRGAQHQKKIAAMQITKKGIVIYPQQEVFGGI